MDRFEGPEKKLAIVLSDPQTGLRDSSGGGWDRVVRACGAEILKRESVEKLDSYLLSESSLFVWDDRLLIITCGRTTPVMALPVILEFVARDRIAYLFYERKNLNFPDDQPSDFEADQSYLLKYFAGKSILLGSADRDHIHVFFYANSQVAGSPGISLQLMMHDIDPTVAGTFYCDKQNTEFQADTLARLTEGLYPGMTIDSHFFYPQGYSLNGIADTNFFTIHVTPQPEGSYVSFESNVLNHDSPRVIKELVAIFKPRRYSGLVTTGNQGQYDDMHHLLTANPSGYRARDQMRHQFGHYYTTTFSNFLKQRY